MVAVKHINKERIKTVYVDNEEPFDELKVMRETCRGQASNFIDLIDVFEDKDKYYIVTQFYEKGDLSHFYDRKVEKTPAEVLLKYLAKQLVDAVRGLHERNILHRDIKPSNVLIKRKDTDMQVVLADFGSARQLKDRREKITFKIGTQGFMAPEMILGQPYGLEIDIWCLGALFYFMFTNQEPFYSESEYEMNRRVCYFPINLD